MTVLLNLIQSPAPLFAAIIMGCCLLTGAVLRYSRVRYKSPTCEIEGLPTRKLQRVIARDQTLQAARQNQKPAARKKQL